MSFLWDTIKVSLLIFPSWFQGWQHDPSTLAGLLRLSCSAWGSHQLQLFQQDASSTVHLSFTLDHAHPRSSSSWSTKSAPGLSLSHSHPSSSCNGPTKAVLGFPLVPAYPGAPKFSERRLCHGALWDSTPPMVPSPAAAALPNQNGTQSLCREHS